MPKRDARPTIGCPACGQTFDLDDLLGHLGTRPEVGQFVDGSGEIQSSSASSFEHPCPKCHESFSIPSRAVAALVIEKQTQNLFASISTVIRGGSKLQ